MLNTEKYAIPKAIDAAIGSSELEVVKLLLSQHPELMHGEYIEPWLHIAAENGEIKIADWLLSQGVDINAIGGTFQGNALHWATYYKQREMIEFLIKRGAKLDTHKQISNPLITAAEDGDIELVGLFLKAGIDRHVTYTLPDGHLRNALSYAEELGRAEIANELRAAGCSLPEYDRFEFTSEGHHQIMLKRVSEYYSSGKPNHLSSFTIDKNLPKVSVYLLDPTDSFPFYTVFTIGFSDHELPGATLENDFRSGEFIAHLPLSWQFDSKSLKDKRYSWPIDWFKNVARYTHEQGEWLKAYTIISNEDPPKPLGPGVEMTALLLLADFDQFSPMDLKNSKIVHFYTMLPLYEEEKEFESKHGIVALSKALSKIDGSFLCRPKRDKIQKVSDTVFAFDP